MKKAYKLIAPALIGIFGFSACSTEEGGGFRFPTAESVIGNYQGTIQTPSTDSTLLNETQATVGLDSIYIADMAIDDIIVFWPVTALPTPSAIRNRWPTR